jgi:hypothetical protein
LFCYRSLSITLCSSWKWPAFSRISMNLLTPFVYLL